MLLYIDIHMKSIFMVFYHLGNDKNGVFVHIKKWYNIIYRNAKLEPKIIHDSNFLHMATKCIAKAPVHQNYLEYTNHDRDVLLCLVLS